jgi:hypothetical protein
MLLVRDVVLVCRWAEKVLKVWSGKCSEVARFVGFAYPISLEVSAYDDLVMWVFRWECAECNACFGMCSVVLW